LIINDFTWSPIDEEGGCKECLILKFERHRGGGKEGNTYFHDVSMLSFSRSILLMSVRAGNVMRNTYFGEE
jgi:hypothetical protein